MSSKTSEATFIENCLISGGKVVKILDFGMHPYADTFVAQSQLHRTEPIFPLECYLNPESGQVQLGYISRDSDRYSLYSYSYTSSNSKFARNHWDEYHAKMAERFKLKGKTVVEIGSNDGYLLHQFKGDNKVLGVDPSKEMAKIAASTYGVKTVNKLFTSKTASEIKSRSGQADFVIANNVFNHSNDPLDFAKGVSALLRAGGMFVFESPYWKDTIESKHFDQVYHEHISYFTAKSAWTLLSKVGLEIFDMEVVDYHGGSLRVYARKTGKVKVKKLPIVSKMIAEETKFGLFDPATYEKFQKDIALIRDTFLSKIHDIKSKGHSIVAVGAAAKGNTLLNFYRLDKTIIDYVTDSSVYKQGKYTPLTRIPIVPDEIFKNYRQGVYALILSWNISAPLKENLLKLNDKIKFL